MDLELNIHPHHASEYEFIHTAEMINFPLILNAKSRHIRGLEDEVAKNITDTEQIL
jgi:hypothetical protein